jgi:hypothetical protein
MSSVRELHNKAMSFVSASDIAKREGNAALSSEHALSAAKIEFEAASLIPIEKESEPTRAILMNSAASLAVRSGEYEFAERLFHSAMLGFPPKHIEKSLRDIYDEIQFKRHLEVTNVVLEDADIQLSLDGIDVSPGFVFYQHLRSRLGTFESLLRRTYNRLMDLPWADIRKKISLPYFSTALSVPRSASFAVTIRLTRPVGDQLSLPIVSAKNVIDEVLDSVRLIQDGHEDLLKAKIQDPAYLRHFLMHARELAPDGERIRTVGLTSQGNRVAFRRNRSELTGLSATQGGDTPEGVGPIKVVGTLDEARKSKNSIVLRTEDNEEYWVQVLDGMEDIVRSNFARNVTVIGTLKPSKSASPSSKKWILPESITGEDL